jgi:hypothetical protein
MIFKLRALYIFAACSLYTALFSLKIFNSRYIINEVVKDYNNDIDRLPIEERGDKFDNAAILKTFFMFEGVIYLGYFVISGIYVYKLNCYNNSMIAFHTFLNNYRQTPRSRFIRKYKPAQEPIYEENSAFERSYMSS